MRRISTPGAGSERRILDAAIAMNWLQGAQRVSLHEKRQAGLVACKRRL